MTQPLPRLGKQFGALFTASSLSNLADGVLSVGIGLVAINMTTSPTLISLAAAAFTLPWLLFGMYSGVIIDRSDRRRIILIATAVRIASLATIAVALAGGFLNYPILLALIFIFGTCEVFADNAYTVLIPAIVPTSRLAAANSRLLSAQQVTNNFLGAPASGLLFAIGAAWTFGVPAALCAAAFFIIRVGLRGNFRPEITAEKSGGKTRKTADLKQGVAYLFRHPVFRPLVLASAAQNMVFTGYFSIFILWVVGPESRLKLAEAHYGMLFTLLAVGSICGAFIVEKLLTRFHEIRVLGASWLIATLLLIVPLVLPHLVAIAIMLFISGMCNTIGNTVSMTLRQRLIPSALLGRVFGAAQTINLGLIPFGTLLAGFIAQFAGMPAWFISATVLATAAVLLAIRAVPPSAIPPAVPAAASPTPGADAGLPDALPIHDSPAAVFHADPPSGA